MIQNHEIDYKIYGEEMQYVEVELDPNESAIAEPGAFMMMEDGIQMETLFGDGSGAQSGFLGKLMNAGKRLLVGENLFMTAFTNTTGGIKTVSFASPYPGKIIPLDLSRYQNKIICQKDAFLCAAKGVSVGIEFQRKLGTGLFGGEGFIKYVYYFILTSHIFLSILVIPFVLFTYLRGISGQFEEHKKIARYTFPLWLYVAVTGVIVYFMISPYY